MSATGSADTTSRTARDDLTKGAVAGLIGGLAASWVMVQFTTLWTRALHGRESTSAGGEHDARDWQERSEDENATEIMAQAIATSTIGRRLTRDELSVAAPLVHYGYGAVMGAVYGGVAERSGGGLWQGAAWGTALWIVGDEMVVPALDLSGAPQSYTREAHAQAFAAHVVYGLSTDIVRRLTRTLM
jgi:uncharacterized membrane protein YagU involved in acid resistance